MPSRFCGVDVGLFLEQRAHSLSIGGFDRVDERHASKQRRRKNYSQHLVYFFPLAAGPHPRRELTLTPRLGSTCPRLGVAAGAFPLALGPYPRRELTLMPSGASYSPDSVSIGSLPVLPPIFSTGTSSLSISVTSRFAIVGWSV